MQSNGRIVVATIVLAACSGLMHAQHPKPIAHPIGAVQSSRQSQGIVALAQAASPWTPLTNQPAFLVNGASNPILLMDGSVLIQDQGFPDWWKLAPDQNGSYVNGTWTQIASLPASYSPLYHSTAVLPDGRMIIEGGEYLLSADQTTFVPTWTNEGAIYDPVANTWTPINPPAGWDLIGDAQSVVLANGTYMQANCCTTQAALLNPTTLTWSPTGANKFDVNDEEGWTLLPNGQVLAVDAYVPVGLAYIPNGTNSELYNPATGYWSTAGSTIVQLWDSAANCGGENVASFELGPAVLRPDGTVFYTGSNSCGAGNTAIYDSNHGRWKPGPRFPSTYDIADGPAALEPNGKVLMMASPGIFETPSQFFEWDGEELEAVAGPPNASTDSSFYGNMLVLPTGQILLTDFSNDIEIYTPDPSTSTYQWAPLILSTQLVLGRGISYKISGLRFNGMSQGAAYGDDAQAATNFPLVRITNLATHHVFYSRTHNPSSMAVASSSIVSASFDVPSLQETGLSKIEVVANGIASPAIPVLIR